MIKRQKEIRGEYSYMPSEKGDERELYFLTQLGTPKYGHYIEDKNRRRLYEAKMTRYTMIKPFHFVFIDREKGITTPHLIGHEENTDHNPLIPDIPFRFTFDGEDIWEHLERSGISIEAQFNSGRFLTGAYTIFRDGEQIACVESTSRHPREDGAEKAGKSPVQGFYRIETREKNLDLLFVTILALARCGAADDNGSYNMLFGFLNKNK